MQGPNSTTNYTTSIAIIGALFFIFGFVTWLNGPLISFVQARLRPGSDVDGVPDARPRSTSRTSSSRCRRR